LKKKKTTHKLTTCIRVSAIFTGLFTFAVFAFLFLPWENYFFTDEELQNYLELLEDGQEGDWVMRQFLATVDQNFTEPSLHETPCYQIGYAMERSYNASPQSCGIMITDSLMKPCEIARLRRLAANITETIGYQSYANRESINLRWMNLHVLFRKNKTNLVLKQKDYDLIRKASLAAKAVIAHSFGLPYDQLHFYVVSQFTRYRSVVPFSEFRHVDKVRSPSLVVTSILWLSTVDQDFGGGRTEFLVGDYPEPNTPLLVEPKVGRFAAWTSGWENPHGVMAVNWGDRLALIFAFTVNPTMGYKDLEDLKEFAVTREEFDY